MQVFRRIFMLVTVAAAISARVGESEDAQFPPVVAIINGETITRATLERRIAQSRSMAPERFDHMSAEEKKRAITRVITVAAMRELEYQQALKQGIVAGEQDVEELYAQERKRFATSAEFEGWLAE